MSPFGSLLERLGVDPAIAGDLIEEYASGRSWIWLLWQASAATVLAIVRGIRQHKVLAIRAILVGCLALNVALRFLRFVYDPLLGFAAAQPWLWFLVEPVLRPMLLMLGALAAGWITGRLHRPYSVPMAAGLWIAAVIMTAPEICRLLADALTNPRFLPFLWGYVADIALVGAGLLLGAAMSASRSEDSTRSQSA